MNINDNNPEFEITVVGSNDDLAKIVDDINSASWDDANEMSTYDVLSLTAYLQRQDTLFITCYNHAPKNPTLLGFCSSRFEIKPYAQQKWLYVDEVDVCANYRNKGVGKAMMQRLLDIARNAGCEELWLGTEIDNVAANALYRSLSADEIEQFVGYTYQLDV